MESTQQPSNSEPPRLLQLEESRKQVAQARRRAAETDEDRQKCLAARREFDTASRAAETSEQRQKRLNAQKDAQARWRAAGTSEDRRQRFDREKIRRARRSCGLYLEKDVFSHGQLYVAMSRVGNSNNLSILSRSSQCCRYIHG